MLTVSNLHFNIVDKPILSNVSFTLQRGEIVGFVGDNGSGKTTTLSIISGCMRPSTGTIHFQEHSIWDNLPQYHRSMGYVPDQIPLYANATVFENLMYSAELKGISQPNKQAHSILDELNLRSIEHQAVRTLSKGLTQWVGIAQSWISKPQLLLLDEPTSGLDPSGRKRFMEWLNNIRTEGHTVFFSSHILSEVESVCDRILWLDKGQLIPRHSDPTQQIRMLCVLEEAPGNVEAAFSQKYFNLIQTLKDLDGVYDVQPQETGLHIDCTLESRSIISNVLCTRGLLEFRRIS